jgi:hypothetical protein
MKDDVRVLLHRLAWNGLGPLAVGFLEHAEGRFVGVLAELVGAANGAILDSMF